MTKKAQAREERLRFLMNMTRGKDLIGTDILRESEKVDVLISSAKSLRKIYERQCNGYQKEVWEDDLCGKGIHFVSVEDTAALEKDERKEERLKKRIEDLVAEMSAGTLVVRHQGDPRGASVDIVPADKAELYDAGFSSVAFCIPDWL